MHSSFKLFPILFAVLAALFAYWYPNVFSDFKLDFIPKQQSHSTPITIQQAEPTASILTADMSVSRQVIKKVFAVETAEVSSLDVQGFGDKVDELVSVLRAQEPSFVVR